jgi:predicted DNA-binding transcriptional regulator AlpA
MTTPLPDRRTVPRPHSLGWSAGMVTSPHAAAEAPAAALPLPRLLWGWAELVEATSIPRRTLEREISAGRFPRPIKRVGRRPFWKPADVIAWAEGSGR